MSDDMLDRLIEAARSDLEQCLAPVAPGLDVVGRRARSRHRAMAAAVVLVAGTVALVAVQPEREASVVAGPGSGNLAALLAPGQTRRLPRSPLAGRSTIASVWTGTEMLLWGGDGDQGPFDDGAAYSPARDAWRRLPDGPLSARNAPAAVWTGTEMLLWGGHGEDGDHADGASFDPATGRWRSMAEAPIRSAGGPRAVWTGTEMLVLAGFNSHDAAAYDPASDAWRQLPDLPGQLQTPTPAVAWTGSQVAVALAYPGPSGPGTGPGGEGSGIFVLAPKGTTWAELPRIGSGQIRLAWTGNRLLAVAGRVAAVLEESGSRWSGLAQAPRTARMNGPVTVWTGAEMLLWDGAQASVIDPDRRSWRTTPAGGLSQRQQPAAVWADGVFVAWGGFPSRADGVVLRPNSGHGASSGPVEVPTVQPSQERVAVAGPGGRRGTFVPGSPPAVWNGKTLGVLPAHDASGNLMGYVGCRFFERSEVERADFDAAAGCPRVTAVEWP